jgi:GxxExxY protein
MPVFSPVSPRTISKEDFARLDYEVMRLAFESQNDFGRLCDETIYENDLAARIEAAGLGSVQKQLPLTITHKSFKKTYYLDLVVADAAVYELKTATTLVNDHDTQLLNYLYLWDAEHGKLLNFRSAKVEARFVNNPLKPESRKRFTANLDRWRETDPQSKLLRETFLALLEDWGAFLEIPLYTEALVHFLGGDERVVHPIPLSRNGIFLGNQKMPLLTLDSAFCITSLTQGTAHYERHLSSFLRYSPIRRFQWINLDQHKVHFITWPR